MDKEILLNFKFIKDFGSRVGSIPNRYFGYECRNCKFVRCFNNERMNLDTVDIILSNRLMECEAWRNKEIKPNVYRPCARCGRELEKEEDLDECNCGPNTECWH